MKKGVYILLGIAVAGGIFFAVRTLKSADDTGTASALLIEPKGAATTMESLFVPFAFQTNSVDLATIPLKLRMLFDGAKSSYPMRCRLVKALGTSLPDTEVSALLLFITSTPEAVGMSRGHFNSVADKVLNKLEEQENVPSVLIDDLMGMFYDESGDYTWRDYCVQHLGSLYSTPVADGKREAIRRVFEDAAQPGSKMAGTAALALKNNVGKEGISPELAAQLAATVALDENQDDADRLTAMLTAAELGNQEMLTLARRIIGSKNSIHFRMSSMATIGMLGNASDLPTLEKYINSSDMRLRLAAQGAVKKINNSTH
jgi:hypothetical protein